MKALGLGVILLAFATRHWAALAFAVLAALTVFVFAPRHMEGAMLASAIVGTGVVVGHWWAG
jgi:hypothetical protein